MKLLQIHAEFMLPDTFNGTLPDALLELAAYMAGPAEERLCDELSEGLNIKQFESKMLEILTREHKARGIKVVSSHYLGDWPT